MAYDQEEQEYVVIKDPQQPGECFELPTNIVDGNLALTLEHYFPGACGLKYKDSKTGATRIVLLDDSGKNFVPPPDGWAEKMFQLIFRPAAVPQPQGEQSKTDDDDNFVKVSWTDLIEFLSIEKGDCPLQAMRSLRQRLERAECEKGELQKENDQFKKIFSGLLKNRART